MKQALENVLKWILASSANPDEVSLTVKGFLVGSIPLIMAVAGFNHLNLGDASALTALFDGFAQLVQNILTIIATVMMVYGVIRKIVIGTGFKSSVVQQ